MKPTAPWRKVRRICHDTLRWLISVSLDLMRSAVASLPLVLLLASCAETPQAPPPSLVLDGIPIYGRTQSLPKSAVRAAITEDRKSSPGDKIYSIDVASSSEVRVYHTERSK